LVLHRNEPLARHVTGDFGLVAGDVADAECPNEASIDKLDEGTDALRERNSGIRAVQLVEVDRVDSKAPK
jgi:hypothetical protein